MGEQTPNVIPEYTKAKYYIRVADIDTLHELYEKVENIVKGSALQTGCTSSMKLYQNLVENMVLTPSLDAIYEKYITELGNTVKHVEDVVMPGSSDVGNISQVVPTIHHILVLQMYRLQGIVKIWSMLHVVKRQWMRLSKVQKHWLLRHSNYLKIQKNLRK